MENAFNVQECGLYGGRVSRKSLDTMAPPPLSTRSTSLGRTWDDYVSHGELSPGLLDLHSFDTELLPEVSSFQILMVFSGKIKYFII